MNGNGYAFRVGLFCIGLLSSGFAQALALGKIQVQSNLNAPLKAEIKLHSVTQGQSVDIRVALGSAATFKRAQLPRPHYLTKFVFKIITKDNGESFIAVRSKGTMKEPILDFIIEVDWLTGKTQKHYTVFLNPGFSR